MIPALTDYLPFNQMTKGHCTYLMLEYPCGRALKLTECSGHWDGYIVKRHFRNAIYTIMIKNPKHVSGGVKSMVIDSRKIEGNVIPLYSDGCEHVVIVTLGR